MLDTQVGDVTNKQLSFDASQYEMLYMIITSNQNSAGSNMFPTNVLSLSRDMLAMWVTDPSVRMTLTSDLKLTTAGGSAWTYRVYGLPKF